MITEDGEEYGGIYQRDVVEGELVTLVSPSREFVGTYDVHEAILGQQEIQPTPIRQNISADQLENILEVREKVMGLPTRHIT